MVVALPEPEGLPPALQARFALLQQRYVSGLAARWAEIEACPQGASLQGALHRLCGSAASYGLEPLSRQARLAEQLAGQDDAQALVQALQDLKREMDRVCSAVPPP